MLTKLGKHGQGGHLLEVTNFWCWSGCGSRISYSLSFTLGDRHFYDIPSFTRGKHCSGHSR